MSQSNKSIPLTAEEYEVRCAFLEVIKTMSQNEYIGVACILQKHGIALSENQTGFLFDLVTVPNAIMDELLEFHRFVEKNEVDLQVRTSELDELKATTWKGLVE